MLRLVLVCLMACAAGKAANGARREVTFAGTPPCDSQHCSVMWFDHGFLFSSGDPTQGPRELLSAWDRSGRLVYEARIGFPDGTPSNIGIGAADGDGTVAMPVSDSDSNGRGQDRRGGVAILDPRGKQVRFIDTGAFVPGSVCFGEDHSLWVGGDLGAWDYALIRHYSRDGELLGGFFPRSSFPYFSPPAAFGVTWMLAAPGRIGFLTFSGDATYTPEWVEFDRTGRETGRWPSMSDELTPINVSHHRWAADRIAVAEGSGQEPATGSGSREVCLGGADGGFRGRTIVGHRRQRSGVLGPQRGRSGGRPSGLGAGAEGLKRLTTPRGCRSRGRAWWRG